MSTEKAMNPRASDSVTSESAGVTWSDTIGRLPPLWPRAPWPAETEVSFASDLDGLSH